MDLSLWLDLHDHSLNILCFFYLELKIQRQCTKGESRVQEEHQLWSIIVSNIRCTIQEGGVRKRLIKGEQWGSVLPWMSDSGLLSIMLNFKPTQNNITWIKISRIIMLLECKSKSFPIILIYTNIWRMVLTTLDEIFDKHWNSINLKVQNLLMQVHTQCYNESRVVRAFIFLVLFLMQWRMDYKILMCHNLLVLC